MPTYRQYAGVWVLMIRESVDWHNFAVKKDIKRYAPAEFGVVSPQFGILMSATENGIKTVGEAMGKAAQKN